MESDNRIKPFLDIEDDLTFFQERRPNSFSSICQDGIEGKGRKCARNLSYGEDVLKEVLEKISDSAPQEGGGQ